MTLESIEYLCVGLDYCITDIRAVTQEQANAM